MENVQIAAVLLVVILALVVLKVSITVVRPDEAIVILRLGRADRGMVRGPGLHFLIPVIDRPIRIGLRETVSEATVTGMSKDEVLLSVDLAVRWRVVDPLKSVLNVADVAEGLMSVASDELRELDADDAIANRDRVRDVMEAKLNEVATRWGGTILRVEVRGVARAMRTS